MAQWEKVRDRDNSKKGQTVQQLPLEDRYEIDIAYSAEDDAFVARIPDLPFTGGHGDTQEEALAMAKAAIRAYIETARESGKQIPEPTVAFS